MSKMKFPLSVISGPALAVEAYRKFGIPPSSLICWGDDNHSFSIISLFLLYRYPDK